MKRRSLLLGSASAAALSQVSSLTTILSPVEAAPGLRTSRSRRTLEVRCHAAERSIGQIERNLETEKYVEDSLQFSKGLLHNRILHFDKLHHRRIFTAIENNDFDVIEENYKSQNPLVNPIAANAIADVGRDATQYRIASAPGYSTTEFAWEAAEIVWASLCRDVPFVSFDSSEICVDAAATLYSAAAPSITATAALFRPSQRQHLSYPYISQFLCVPISVGGVRQGFGNFFLRKDKNYLGDFDEFLSVYNGNKPPTPAEYDEQERIPATPRDLCSVVYKDFPSQYFMYAAHVLFGFGKQVLNRNNPYKTCKSQSAFVSFGMAHCFDLLNRVACRALQIAWYYKWNVFRRARPEEYFGLWHVGEPPPSVDRGVLIASLQKLRQTTGGYLLPQAYPEGAPLHPAYPAGHAVVSGACGTVLKCLFDEDAPWPTDLLHSEDGRDRTVYRGSSTVGEEIDKLMWNISFGRTFAGIHWRSDCESGISLGEQIAVDVMNECKMFQAEEKAQFSVMSFDRQELQV